jgi:hypothetical protein
MKLRPIPETAELPDGVYIGLPEARYFQQSDRTVPPERRRRGSTDVAAWWLKKEGWWWKSELNPFWARVRRDPMTFGSALHALLLEGRDAFNARYGALPNKAEYPDLIETIDDLRSALASVNAPGFKARATKDNMLELARVYLQSRHVWDLLVERARKANPGKLMLSAEDVWQLDIMLAAAEKDPNMAAVATASGGVRLTELSVLWTTPQGLRLRFRFDSLLPTVNADLKSIDNFRGDTLGDAIGKRIGADALDVQAAMSFEARKVAYEFIRRGHVYGGTDEQREWLARFPAEAPLDAGPAGPGWSWVWMFYQKADVQGRAPTIMPVRMAYGGLRHLDGYRKMIHGMTFYLEQVAKVGLKEPWTRVEPIHHLDASAENEIRIPSWVQAPHSVEGELQAMNWRSPDA